MFKFAGKGLVGKSPQRRYGGRTPQKERSGPKYLPTTVFLTQIISRRQKNADAKVVLLISRRQKWNSRLQFSKNCIFPNIQLKGVLNILPPFKNLSHHTNKFLMG